MNFLKLTACHLGLSKDTGMVAAVQAKNISDMIISLELQRPKLTPVHIQWDLGIENSDRRDTSRCCSGGNHNFCMES